MKKYINWECVLLGIIVICILINVFWCIYTFAVCGDKPMIIGILIMYILSNVLVGLILKLNKELKWAKEEIDYYKWVLKELENGK